MDIMDRIMELSQKGYLCSQILTILLLETVGEENKELVKSVQGLCGGVGFTWGCCGCMTGGTCFLSYFLGKGEDGEDAHPEYKAIMKEFTDWFKARMAEDFAGTDCWDVIQGVPAKRVEMCPPIIADTYVKCMEILNEKGLL